MGDYRLMPRITRTMGFLASILVAAVACTHPSTQSSRNGGAHYEVFATRYGTVERFPTSALVAGADTSRRLDIAMMVWLARLPGGRNVLVDAGFYRDKFVSRWKPKDYERPSS